MNASNKNTNIFIIGYMGSGKTTVGQSLSKQLGKKFLDMDNEIEKKENMSIAQIFMKYGEHQFRNLEAELLDNILEENMVISCGGGIILDEENRRVLENKTVVFLDCEPEIMFERIKNNENLPNAYFHIKDEDERRDIFIRQYGQRKNLYEKIADNIINTGNRDIDDIVNEICNNIERN